MSELSVTKITDRVGTGKVNFSQGFKVAGTLDTTLAPTRTEGNTEPATPVNGDTWYDTDNDTYDVYINDEWKRFLGAGGGAVSWTVDLSNVTYDSISTNLFYSQDFTPFDIAFSNDGTKVYMLGQSADYVYQYSLSTAFDLSTISYDSVSISINSQETFPTTVVFNSDGTKMYITGEISDAVHEYSLSTAWDLSTASYSNVNFSTSAQIATSICLRFSTDGTKMYVISEASTRPIHQYSLSTAFDVSTASYDSVSFNLSSQDTGAQSISFNTDGTKMYMIGTTSDAVHQYSLSTGFDLSTASYDSVSFGTSGQQAVATSLVFSSDGTKMYVGGLSPAGAYYQYSTGL